MEQLSTPESMNEETAYEREFKTRKPGTRRRKQGDTKEEIVNEVSPSFIDFEHFLNQQKPHERA